MYTEEEAKKKRCPQRVNVQFLYSTEAPPLECVSSQCMAWRWAQRETRMTGDDVTYVKVGYCGLAGKP
jgi:hypothetical protein